MRYYPICLDLNQRAVLVVGGGLIAEGKILQLLEASANVHVVSLAFTPPLATLAAQQKITTRQGEFSPNDLDKQCLVICATDSRAVNESVAAAAAEKQILCNVVDQPDLCNFITPSLVTRGDLQISISTAGKSPTVAQRVKQEIGALIGDEYRLLLELTAALRLQVRTIIPTFAQRRDFLQLFVHSNALELIKAGEIMKAEALGQNLLKKYRAENNL